MKPMIVVIEDEEGQRDYIRREIKKSDPWIERYRFHVMEAMEFGEMEAMQKKYAPVFVVLDLNALMFTGARDGIYAYAMSVIDIFPQAVCLLYSAIDSIVPDVIEEIEDYLHENKRVCHALKLRERFDPDLWYENYISKYEG